MTFIIEHVITATCDGPGDLVGQHCGAKVEQRHWCSPGGPVPYPSGPSGWTVLGPEHHYCPKHNVHVSVLPSETAGA